VEVKETKRVSKEKVRRVDGWIQRIIEWARLTGAESG
jgi:hypothetical protein